MDFGSKPPLSLGKLKKKPNECIFCDQIVRQLKSENSAIYLFQGSSKSLESPKQGSNICCTQFSYLGMSVGRGKPTSVFFTIQYIIVRIVIYNTFFKFQYKYFNVIVRNIIGWRLLGAFNLGPCALHQAPVLSSFGHLFCNCWQ